MIGEAQWLMIVGENDALIAEAARMPFEPEERGERVVPVGILDEVLDLRPTGDQTFEAVLPMAFTVALHRCHVMPRRMPSEGKEIEMRSRDIDSSFERSEPITQGVVIMDVAKECGEGHAIRSAPFHLCRGTIARKAELFMG